MATSQAHQQLEQELLRAQIEHFADQRKRRLIGDALPSIAALVVVILVAVVALLLINNHWNRVVEDARVELNEIGLAKETVAREISVMQDESADAIPVTGANDPVGLQIEFHGCSVDLCSFSAESSARDVSIRLFRACEGTFEFPGGAPDLGGASCPEINVASVCSALSGRTICRFGPYVTVRRAVAGG